LATERLGWSASSKLSRIELAKSSVKSADLHSLLDLYEVTAARREELWKSRTSGAVAGIGMRRPEEQIACLKAEADAEAIWIWDSQVIPGLFQTDDYARALLQAPGHQICLASAGVDHRIQTYRLHKRGLTRDAAPRVSAVIDESVLRRRVGEPSRNARAACAAGRDLRIAEC